MDHFELKRETVTINEMDYLIETLKDRQQYGDEGQAAEALGISSATWPIFGLIWPASKVLAAAVSEMDLDGKRVLEVGCGIALSSIVLHRMGVDITASDYHPLAKRFLDANILRNDLPPIQYLTGNWETENPLLGSFDLIIGSDVLYEPDHAGNLSQFIDIHSDDDVEVMIVDPERGNRAKFTRNMLELGYTHRFERFDVREMDDQCKGRIMYYRRQNSS